MQNKNDIDTFVNAFTKALQSPANQHYGNPELFCYGTRFVGSDGVEGLIGEIRESIAMPRRMPSSLRNNSEKFANIFAQKVIDLSNISGNQGNAHECYKLLPDICQLLYIKKTNDFESFLGDTFFNMQQAGPNGRKGAIEQSIEEAKAEAAKLNYFWQAQGADSKAANSNVRAL